MDSPLEALAFRHSAVLAGSAWAWLVVLAAALGLWRIRAAGPPNLKPAAPHAQPLACAAPHHRSASTNSTPEAPGSPPCHVEGGGESTPKGRFTAYFHVEDDGSRMEEEEEGEDGNGLSDGVRDEAFEWKLGGHIMEMRRRGDLGWYRYQDRTALNGSVVRLWDVHGGMRRRI